MTRIVALVRSPEDVSAAVAGGVDGLVLQASSGVPLTAILDKAGGRCPVSFWYDQTGTDAVMPDGTSLDALWNAPDDTRVSAPRWAVVPPGDLAGVDAAAQSGRPGIVVAGTRPGRLLANITIATLEHQRRAAAALGLRFGIAGGMEAPDVSRLLALEPDILVMDDLLREPSASESAITVERVCHARDLVAACSSAEAKPRSVVPSAPDHIFVRDWTVPLHLGAYAHERAPQRVRFNVDVEVVRVADRAVDMRDIVTYDLITDAIARATISHVALVETIAEDVAQLILMHPRVSGVDVTVEKLDLGPGALGCRIQRRRAS